MSKPLFESLNLVFDTAKFGNALDPRENLEDTIIQTPPLLRKWQYEAIVNGETSPTLYLKNPLANVINAISITANNIYNSTNTFLYLANANSAAANVVTAANNFFRHTQRLSGVETSTNLALPDFSTATGYGYQAFMLVSKFEEVSNNTPILGSMTSLFVEDDLLTYSVQLNQAYTDLVNSIVTIGALPPYTYSSNLSVSRIQEIVGLLSNTSNFMDTRRNHDVAFFGNVIRLSNNYIAMTKFSGFTDLTAHLVENYVGTDKLKNNL